MLCQESQTPVHKHKAQEGVIIEDEKNKSGRESINAGNEKNEHTCYTTAGKVQAQEVTRQVVRLWYHLLLGCRNRLLALSVFLDRVDIRTVHAYNS